MTANSLNSVPQIHHTKDYLGNIRNVLAKKDGVVKEVQHTAYYPFGGIIADLSTGRGVQNRFYNGKELDYANNLYWLDYGARQYDPTRGQFTTPDPLAEKYYGWNMYGYCVNNPIIFIDPTGEKPTHSEAARIAAHVYGDKSDKILSGGWKVSERDFGVTLVTNSGLKSAVYERTVNGETEYVYATAGTQISDAKDWEANLSQPFGFSEQYSEAAYNAKQISEALVENEELTFVGHSLGGGEAALNSLVTSSKELPGREAITFNAAFVSSITKVVNGNILTPLKSEKNITAFVMLTDPLNKVTLPANGTICTLYPQDWQSIVNGHSMDNILKCFGVNK